MEKRTPFFLTKLFRKIPQNSEFNEAKGWGDIVDETRFNGWDSSSGSSNSGVKKTNGWLDEPLENNDYNGWGSVSLPKSRTPEPTNYNGWGSGSGSGGRGRSSDGRSGGWMDELPECNNNNGWDVPKSEATNNGRVGEKPKDEYNGWGSGSGSGGNGRSSVDRSGGWTGELPEGDYNGWDTPESNPINQHAEIDVNSLPIAKPTPLKVESWAPSAPPIPDGGFSENPAANEGGNGGALCVVCWEGPIEGACVPCGHMASCMTCLHEIESRNGTCPICRSKIDKVIRIYAISTK